MTISDPRKNFELIRSGLFATCERGYQYFGDEDSGFYTKANHLTPYNVERLLRDIAVRGEDTRIRLTNLQNYQGNALVRGFIGDGRARLVTFENWNHPSPSKFSLAQAGFVYSGAGDVTYTYCCQETVKNWVPGMDPAEVHADRRKDCNVAKSIMGFKTDALECDLRAMWETVEEIPQGIERDYKLGKPYDMRHNSLRARLLSFDNWPYPNGMSPVKLAQAGFYFEGKVDFVRCYYCNGGVMDWTNGDDPFIRHAQMYSDCVYIRIIKGEQFMLQSQRYPSSIPTWAQREDFIPAELQCPYCVSRRMRIILGPCGHVGGCGNCSHQHANCPVCRRKVMGRFQINF